MAFGAWLESYEEIAARWRAAGREYHKVKVIPGSMQGPTQPAELKLATLVTGVCPRCGHSAADPELVVMGCSCGYGMKYCTRCGGPRFDMPGELCLMCSPGTSTPPRCQNE